MRLDCVVGYTRDGAVYCVQCAGPGPLPDGVEEVLAADAEGLACCECCAEL